MPKKIDVGAYHLAYETFGSGQPSVVFECGIKDSSQSLIGIARQLEPYTQVFTYDRAGLGESEPAPKPRTIEDAVNDLHTLLQRAKIPGPYIVVGHSYGGLIARHFASKHLHELKGLVLLDVPHPELPIWELALLP